MRRNEIMYNEFSYVPEYRPLTEEDFPEEFASDAEYWEMLEEMDN